MPRARSPNRDKAKDMWIASGKKRLLKDIAAELGVSESKVRKWKSEDKWDADKSIKSNGAKRNAGKGSVPKRNKGGQPGNKNAVGNNGGAPLGNTNNLKHGGYSRIYWDTLDEEEQELILTAPKDEEQLLLEQIQLFSVRERRLMKAINKYKDLKGGLAVTEVLSDKTIRDFGIDKSVANQDKALYDEMIRKKIKDGERLPGNAVNVATRTEATYNIIQSLEKELTNVQGRKTKCIDSLAKLRMEKERMNSGGKGSEIVDDWVSAVISTMEVTDNE